MRKHILLGGHDVAQTDAFERLKTFLESSGVPVRAFLLDAGKTPAPSETELAEAINWADIVISGLSTKPQKAAMEIRMLEMAREASTPKLFGVYVDTPGAENRAHFAHVLKDASFFFVVNEGEKKVVQAKFKSARVEATGNPSREDYFLPADRAASRKLVEAKEDTCVIYVPFVKTRWLNELKARWVFDALAQRTVVPERYVKGNYHIVINVHRGDETTLSEYQESLGKCLAGRFGSEKKLHFSTASADELVPGTDVVIGPATSVSWHAMARGIPILDLVNPAIETWLLDDIGATQTYIARNGGSLEVRGVGELKVLLQVIEGVGLADKVVEASLKQALARQREVQSKILTRVPQGTAVKKMVAFLDKV